VGCLAVRTPIGRTIIAWKGVSEENACNNLSRYLNSRSSLAAAPFEPAAHQLRKLDINVEGISLAGGRADEPSRDNDPDIILTLVWRIRARI
jgi:hypothetical protein